MVKNLPVNAGDAASIPGWEDPLEEEMATHFPVFLENPMNRGSGWVKVHGVAKSWT